MKKLKHLPLLKYHQYYPYGTSSSPVAMNIQSTTFSFYLQKITDTKIRKMNGSEPL